jgi:homoserine kinase
LLGCALSGAGPSILVFFERGHESVTSLVQQVFQLHGRASEVLFPHLAEQGYTLQRCVAG